MNKKAPEGTLQGLGGRGRNRTVVRGFADPCLNHSATRPFNNKDKKILEAEGAL